jgi:hypothetical protein
MNFEQSLLKLMTSRKRWSTTTTSGWPQGRSLVVQVSGGALTRTSGVAPSIKIKSKFFGEIGSTQFLSRARALLFFFETALFFEMICERSFARHCEELSRRSNPILAYRPGLFRGSLGARSRGPAARNDGHSFELAAGRREDLTPLVYRRPFIAPPEAQLMFRRAAAKPKRSCEPRHRLISTINFRRLAGG